jgi:H+-translocating NAD(P) transhydrogenase subunit alpha
MPKVNVSFHSGYLKSIRRRRTIILGTLGILGISKIKGARNMSLGLLIFVFVLAIFLGVELISKVPSQLHTPLMSGTNAISGITIVGALTATGASADLLGTILGTIALVFATINVVGGYLVTNRMLAMFKRKDGENK